jgi:hypothetical protein
VGDRVEVRDDGEEWGAGVVVAEGGADDSTLDGPLVDGGGGGQGAALFARPRVLKDGFTTPYGWDAYRPAAPTTSCIEAVASPGKERGQGEGEGEEEGEEEEGGEDEAAAILQLALHALWAPNSGGGGFSDPAAAVAATAGAGSGGQPQRVQLQLRALAAERDEAALAAARAEAATQRLLKGAAAMRTFFTQKVFGSALDVNMLSVPTVRCNTLSSSFTLTRACLFRSFGCPRFPMTLVAVVVSFLPILCAGAQVRELETDAAAAKKLSFAQPAAAAPTLFGAKPLRRDAAALPGEAAATAAASESQAWAVAALAAARAEADGLANELAALDLQRTTALRAAAPPAGHAGHGARPLGARGEPVAAELGHRGHACPRCRSLGGALVAESSARRRSARPRGQRSERARS